MEKENTRVFANVNVHREILSISPIKSINKSSTRLTEELKVLVCAQFQSSLYLNFGNVSVNKTHSVSFSLQNPDKIKAAFVSLERCSPDLVFQFDGEKQSSVTIQPMTKVDAIVFWTPLNEKTMRESVTLKLDNKAPLQITLQGVSSSDKSRKPQLQVAKKTSSLQQTAPTNSLDSQWAEKQANSFTDWMNFLLNQSQRFSSAAELDENLTESESLGINQLAKKTAEVKTRQAAVAICRSSQMVQALYAVQEELSVGKLSVREDRDVLQDLGLQEALFGILFSYESRWLCLAMGVLFGKTFFNRSMKNQRLKSSLKTFVLENLLSDVDIVARYGPQTALYMSADKKMKAELRRNFVFKFLSLVLILDVTRVNRLLPFDALFAKDSIYKSSKDVLQSFCRCFLRGEGDFMRHLGLIHYSVRFVQSFVDEFDFPVTNLAVDLRDGVRLARLLDLLTDDKEAPLTKQLRVPAVSRLQKLHNVSTVIGKLDWTGEKAVEAKHVVDGNRSMTLVLLWKIMFSHELGQLITPTKVMREVQLIQANDSWRRSRYDGHDVAAMAVRASAGLNACTSVGSVQQGDDLSSALLQWSQAITQNYDVPVKDLTTSFADGRALCLLVHYYHPAVLPTSSIKKTSRNLLDSLRTSGSDGGEDIGDLVSRASASDMQKAINGERRNYLTLKKACKDIGGIPLMLSEFDSRNVPEQRAMMAFLIYLFVRLTESSQQVRAAIRIQRQVRKRLRFAPMRSAAQVGEEDLVVSLEEQEKEVEVDELKDEHLVVAEQLVEDNATSVEESVEVQLQVGAEEEEELVLVSVDSVAAEDVAVECMTDALLFDQMGPSADALSILEGHNRELEGRLVEEMRERVNAELNAKLETEKQLLLMLEMKLLEVSEENRLQAVLAEGETQRIAREEMAQQHRDSLQAAASQTEQEKEARLRVEAQLRESLADNEKERAAAHSLNQQRAALEEQLRVEHEQRQADLVQAELEKERRLAEQQARLMAEALIQQELQVRAEVEGRILVEIEARKALEARLEAIELSRQQQEEEARMSEVALRVVHFTRDRSAALLQRQWRRLVESRRNEVFLSGVSKLQAVYRGGRARRVARCALLAVQILQSSWRRKQCAKMLVLMNRSAAVVQSLWRQHTVKLATKCCHVAASRLQHWCQGRMCRVRFGRFIRKVVLLQTVFRKHHQVARYASAIRSVVMLQKYARRLACAKKFVGAKCAVVAIQNCWRRALARMQSNVDYRVTQRLVALQDRHKNRCCRKIVAFLRAALHAQKRLRSAAKISKWYLSLLPLLRVRKLCRGFRRLGAVRRARKVRKTSSAALQQLLRRIKEADNRARADPSLKLGKQTSAALKILQNGKMISQLLKACQTLELSTSLSRYCCEAFAQAGAPNILFSLLRSCNRSTPHQELLRVALVVLLHVARHDHLAGVVAASSDSAESLVDLMQMFRDKKSLFILATELLARLVNASATSKNSCNTPVIRKRLEGILHIMERKNRLEVRVRSVGEAKSDSAARSLPVGSGSPGSEFAKYKGKAYRSIEPITCIQHLMQLLETSTHN